MEIIYFLTVKLAKHYYIETQGLIHVQIIQGKKKIIQEINEHDGYLGVEEE